MSESEFQMQRRYWRMVFAFALRETWRQTGLRRLVVLFVAVVIARTLLETL